MIISINNKSTKFCQITLRIKRFIRIRKVVSFFLPHGVLRTPSEGEVKLISYRQQTSMMAEYAALLQSPERQ